MSITVKITVNNARTGKHEDVATLHIVNDATGDAERGNYTYVLRTPEGERRGVLTGFRRTHPEGALRLVASILAKERPFVPDPRFREVPRGKAGSMW